MRNKACDGESAVFMQHLNFTKLADSAFENSLKEQGLPAVWHDLARAASTRIMTEQRQGWEDDVKSGKQGDFCGMKFVARGNRKGEVFWDTKSGNPKYWIYENVGKKWVVVEMGKRQPDAAKEADAPSATSGTAPTIAPSAKDGMVTVPSGTFEMGSANGNADELPVHDVQVAGFQINVTEETVGAYRKCVAAEKCTEPKTFEKCLWGKPGVDDQPINCVDWQQAHDYCAWAGKRLPTEEEWEYAARGNDGRKFPWGNTLPTSQVCWAKKGPCPVGQFPEGASPFGVQDMAGNLAEWTASGYSTKYQQPRDETRRVMRGGSWADSGISKKNLQTTTRFKNLPNIAGAVVGFRCAK
jgi:formylglycine-generating enzyme required for sulfatase activity